MIKLAIVGTGGVAHGHVRHFKSIPGCRLVACCDVMRGRAAEFAATHQIPAAYLDIDEMFAQEAIDAISNCTPDAFHAPLSLKAIAKGIHVLCEKPLATNYPDAQRMADMARRKGVINMVNFSYRNSSAIHKAHQLVAQGAVGRVVHFEASYLQSWLVGKQWGDWRVGANWLWRLSEKMGSKGVLGDIGVHILDFASYPAGNIASVNCRLKCFHKAPGDKLRGVTLDANDSAFITVELANGALGTIHTSRWATGYANCLELRIHGDQGAIHINLDKSYTQLEICRGKDIDKVQWKTVACAKTPNLHQRFITSIKTGKNDQPDFARGAAIQKVIDACFASDKTGRTVKT